MSCDEEMEYCFHPLSYFHHRRIIVLDHYSSARVVADVKVPSGGFSFPDAPPRSRRTADGHVFLFVLQQVDEWLNEVNCSFLQQVHSHLVLTFFFSPEIFICKFLTLIVCGRSI